MNRQPKHRRLAATFGRPYRDRQTSIRIRQILADKPKPIRLRFGHGAALTIAPDFRGLIAALIRVGHAVSEMSRSNAGRAHLAQMRKVLDQ